MENAYKRQGVCGPQAARLTSCAPCRIPPLCQMCRCALPRPCVETTQLLRFALQDFDPDTTGPIVSVLMAHLELLLGEHPVDAGAATFLWMLKALLPCVYDVDRALSIVDAAYGARGAANQPVIMFAGVMQAEAAVRERMVRVMLVPRLFHSPHRDLTTAPIGMHPPPSSFCPPPLLCSGCWRDAGARSAVHGVRRWLVQWPRGHGSVAVKPPQ